MRLSLFLLLFPLFLLAQKGAYAPYGGVFTPKGQLKALLVPVYFTDQPQTNPNFKNQEHYLAQWDSQNPKMLPNPIDPKTGRCPSFMANDSRDFEAENLTKMGFNASSLFFLQSKGQFQFTVEVFKDSSGQAAAVGIDPSGGRSWSDMNRKALFAMMAANPNLPLSHLDQRTNRPNFQFDNQNTAPDSLVDYVIFVYRYSPNWSQQPAPGMNRWLGSGGGFASPGSIGLESYQGYSIQQGFTMMWGSNVFVHELAHSLFNAPHFFGANQTVGDYFRRPAIGWGATSTIPIFQLFNAWEAWYMGYLPNLRSLELDFGQKEVLALDDFCTEQEALRIRLPQGQDQWLWLELHQKLHPFDEHAWAGQQLGQLQLSGTSAGLYAYVDDTGIDSLQQIVRALSPACNALYPINAAGNYDYTYIQEEPKRNAWGNPLYRFQRLRPNAVSGTNPFFFFRADLNQDGRIAYNRNYNGARNEGMPIIYEQNDTGGYSELYQSFGMQAVSPLPQGYRTQAFGPGDQLWAGGNPALVHYPKYDFRKDLQAPYRLQDVHIKVLAEENQRYILEIERKAIELKEGQDWAGEIILPNCSKDERVDLILAKKQVLQLRPSGTANRSRQQANGSFVGPTVLTLAQGSSCYLAKKSRLYIAKGCQLKLEKGAKIILGPKAKIIIEKGGELMAEEGQIELGRRAKIIKK